MEDLIANEGCIISITHGGFIKRTAVSAFRAQRRGGKGVIGMSTREGATEEEEGDFVEHLFTATTHDYLMFFTQSGRAYVEKVYEIPEMGRAAKGRSIANILELRARREDRRHDPRSVQEVRHWSRAPSIKHGTKISTSFSRRARASSKNRIFPITPTCAKAASSRFRSRKAIA